MRTKRAAYIWISWVLLFAFAIAMSAIMYNWIFGYTKTSAADIENRAFDAQECESVTISIDSAYQNTKNLYIDVSNRNNLEIDKLIFRLYNIYGEPIDPLIEKRINIKPNDHESTDLPKDGVVKRIEAIPVTFKQDTEIICRERLARFDDIPFK